MQAGQTIAPGSQSDPADSKQSNTAPNQGSKDDEPEVQPKKTETQPQEPAQDASWEYKGGKNDSGAPEPTQAPYVQPVSWTASEYIAHHKNFGWFILMLLAITGVAAVVYLITRDVVSTTVIGIIGFLFVGFAARKPQVLEYSIDGTGVHVGAKSYPFGQFRSFLILEEEAVPTIMLMPIRRFGLPLSLHFEPDDTDKIIDILGSRLPIEEKSSPPVDRLMSKIRF